MTTVKQRIRDIVDLRFDELPDDLKIELLKKSIDIVSESRQNGPATLANVQMVWSDIHTTNEKRRRAKAEAQANIDKGVQQDYEASRRIRQ